MGLTIHYTISPPDDWTESIVREKLEQARQFAMDAPVEDVSDMIQLSGEDAKFGEDTLDDETTRWLRIQSQRSLDNNPWDLGTIIRQSPNKFIAFEITVAPGSEPANFGICWYPEYTWKTDKDSYRPAWSMIFNKKKWGYHAGITKAEKIIRSFMKKYNLKKLPNRKHNSRKVICPDFMTPDSRAEAGLLYTVSPYRKARKGPIVVIKDRYECTIAFIIKNTDTDCQIFKSKEFQQDLTRLASGEDYIIPPENSWSSFCKTQYANSPECGGLPNFIRAHLSVLSICGKLQELGFNVDVYDESGFWESRNINQLIQSIGDWDSMIAAYTGAFKDMLRDDNISLVSAMDGRSDFEHLEAQGQKFMNENLMKIARIAKDHLTEKAF